MDDFKQKFHNIFILQMFIQIIVPPHTHTHARVQDEDPVSVAFCLHSNMWTLEWIFKVITEGHITMKIALSAHYLLSMKNLVFTLFSESMARF